MSHSRHSEQLESTIIEQSLVFKNKIKTKQKKQQKETERIHFCILPKNLANSKTGLVSAVEVPKRYVHENRCTLGKVRCSVFFVFLFRLFDFVSESVLRRNEASTEHNMLAASPIAGEVEPDLSFKKKLLSKRDRQVKKKKRQKKKSHEWTRTAPSVVNPSLGVRRWRNRLTGRTTPQSG